ncbi:hypothetical protein KM043_008684 [Ampulex compressa]|nr:hypothetical protein KM043_008684 [Ampulex compressa]
MFDEFYNVESKLNPTITEKRKGGRIERTREHRLIVYRDHRSTTREIEKSDKRFVESRGFFFFFVFTKLSAVTVGSSNPSTVVSSWVPDFGHHRQSSIRWARFKAGRDPRIKAVA